MLLKLIVGMLAMITSTKMSLLGLQKAIAEYLTKENAEDKHSALIVVLAHLMLVAEKIQKKIGEEDEHLVSEALHAIMLSKQAEETSDEEKEEIVNELMGDLDKLLLNQEDDEDESSNHLHVHDCDKCRAKGDCPIEGVMRQVKSGEMTVEEGEKQAIIITESLHNIEEVQEVQKPTQMNEPLIPGSFVVGKA